MMPAPARLRLSELPPADRVVKALHGAALVWLAVAVHCWVIALAKAVVWMWH